MQAVRVEHSYHNFPTDHKRRCYGDDPDSSLSLSENSVNSINDLDEQDLVEQKAGTSDMTQQELVDTFSHTHVDKSLLDPGDVD